MAKKKRKGGRPKELGPVQVFPLRLPVELHGALRVYAAAKGASLNQTIVDMVSDAWAKLPNRKTYERLAGKPG